MKRVVILVGAKHNGFGVYGLIVIPLVEKIICEPFLLKYCSEEGLDSTPCIHVISILCDWCFVEYETRLGKTLIFCVFSS